MTQKAVFLDRDGTIIHDPGYINHPSQVKLLPGVGQSLSLLKKMGYLLVIVTNQSGVARGMVTEQGLGQIHHHLKKLLADEGVFIDAIYYCPYHPEGTVEQYRRESDLRKPSPGMLLKAAEDLQIDLSRSWMIGDAYRDTTAGSRAGCQTILLDTPGKTQERQFNDPEPNKRAVNLREAVNILRMFEFQQKAKTAQGSRSEAQPAVETPLPEEPNEPLVSETAEPVTIAQPALKEQPATDTPQPPVPTPQMIETLPPAAENAPNAAPPAADVHESSHHQMLEEILHRVKSKTRYDQYDEFSVFMLLAWLLQVMAAFSLVVSIWFWLDTRRDLNIVQTMIGYAIALELLVIALLMMHDKKK